MSSIPAGKLVIDRQAERRLVTCVFVDIVGSTDLTVRLGPERMQRLLGEAFAEISALATAERGTVEKYIGDEVFVLFGAPVAHADDAARALRFADACTRSAVASGSPLAVRIGVETGEALVDLEAVGERQRMAVGACVNLAARLKQLAEPGQVVVGPTSRSASERAAEFVELGRVELKGIGLVSASRLVRLVEPRDERSSFVGRDKELAELGEALKRARDGRTTLVLVSGEPGIGKTRLVEEFARAAMDGARVLQARCRPGTEVGASTPLRQLLADVEPGRLPPALAHSVGLANDARLLALGAVDRQNEVFAAWRDHLSEQAHAEPLLLWIEDVHWAEPELVRLLDRLTFGGRTRLLVVLTARPEFPAVTSLRPGEDRVFLELAPLEEEAALALARGAGARDVERIKRAEGHPLFIVELVRAQDALGEELPVTVQAAIAARLDELAPSERDLLQRAAVVGDTFTVRDAALLGERDPAEVAGVLGRLTHLRYVQSVPGAYRFHHALVRDIALGRLPISQRLHLHARYAREGVHPEDVEALAHHWWEALGPADARWVWEGEPELEPMRADALRAHLAAGRRLTDRLAYGHALVVYEHALQLARDPLETAQVEEAIGLVYAQSARGEDATLHRLRAVELHKAAASGVPAKLYADMLDIPVFNWGYFKRLPDADDMLRLMDEGIDAARATGDRLSLVRLLVQRGFFTNDAAALTEIGPLLESVVDKRPYADPLWRVALVHAVVAGDVTQARRTLDLIFDLSREGAQFNEPEALLWQAMVLFHTGDLSQAEAVADRLMAVSATKSAHTRQHALGVKGLVRLGRGDWPRVIDLAREFRELVEANRDATWCIFGANLAAYGAIGDAMGGRVPRDDLASFVELLLPQAPSTRAAALLPPLVMTGRPVADDEAVGSYEFSRRVSDRQGVLDLGGMNLAIADVMRERWAEAERDLPRLDRLAAKGAAFCRALAAAVREEIAAGRGGSEPRHEALSALGYTGISQLLSYRPAPA